MKTGILTLSVMVNLPRGPNNGLAHREEQEDRVTVESGECREATHAPFRTRRVPVMRIDCTQENGRIIADRFRKENSGGAMEGSTAVEAVWAGPVTL